MADFAAAGAAGKQLGEAWATSKFRKGARQIQQALEKTAKDTGGELDYAALETQLSDLYYSSGAAKRGLSGADGKPLYESVGNEMRGSYARRADASAGALAAQGDLGGALQRRSTSRYNQGNFDDGMKYGAAGEQITAGRAAVKPDGTGVDAPALARSTAEIDARYGDLEGAQQGQQKFQAQRLQAASVLAGQVLTRLSDPETYGGEQTAAAFNSLSMMIPEIGSGLKAKVDADDPTKVWLVRGDQAIRELTADDETRSLLTSFQQDPSGVLKTVNEQIQKGYEEERAGTKATQELYQKTAAKLIETFAASGASPDTAKAVTSAAQNMKSGGWQVLGDAGEVNPATGTISQMVQKDGKVYRMERSSGTPGEGDLAGAGAEVTFWDGDTAVNPNTIPGADSAVDYYTAIETASQEGDFASDGARLKTSLNALNSVLFGGKQQSTKGAVNETSGVNADPVEVGDAIAQGKQWILGLETNGGMSRRDKTNPLGSKEGGAAGRGQFTGETFDRFVEDTKPAWAEGLTQKQIREKRYDDNIMDEAIDWLIQDNVAVMQKEGVPIQPETIYLAHHFGAGKVDRILANPDSQVYAMLSKEEQRQNPTYSGLTWSDLINKFTTRANRAEGKRTATRTAALPPRLDPVNGGEADTVVAGRDALPPRLDYMGGGEMGRQGALPPRDSQARSTALLDPEAARRVAMQRLSEDPGLFQ